MSLVEDISDNGKNFKIADKNTDVTIGVSAVQILQNNPNRIAVIFSNLTSNDVVLDVENSVNLTKGFSLDPLGGLVGFKRSEDGSLPSREWFAVASAANTVIRITEIVKIRGKV